MQKGFFFSFFFPLLNYRILFLRQQSKELDKLKNQNLYMVWRPGQYRVIKSKSLMIQNADGGGGGRGEKGEKKKKKIEE